MEENKESTTICKSVFKSGKSNTTECEFTDKFVELINSLENGKSANFCEKAWS